LGRRIETWEFTIGKVLDQGYYYFFKSNPSLHNEHFGEDMAYYIGKPVVHH